jgi:hypothetical protein
MLRSNKWFLRRAGFALSALCLSSVVVAAANSERVDFNFQIRPILSDRCFKCHGPDEKSRKADLRLDTQDGAFAICDKKTGARAITPHRSDCSEVIRRITSSDPEEKMPPSKSNQRLSAEEIALIRKWIEQGAEYKQHWAFTPVRKPPVPASASKWVRNPIDQFVLARLKRENLEPASETNKETLLRRLSFDLTGLPPSLQEIDEFVQDRSPNAEKKVVERLLASSRYGERMANDWLDLARYADTYGYQADVERDMSPWRDWVIRAFNQNLSYDQFILWQVAGDLLPNATDEEILATAFNRLHRQTNEGGSIEEEFRTEYVADRLHTFGTAFLGLTFECARCHDHKFDPIKQKDYYRLSAFFNNIDESGLYSHFTKATPTPTALLSRAGEKQKLATLKEEIFQQERAMGKIRSKVNGPFKTWLQSGPTNFNATGSIHFSFETIAENKTADTTGKYFGNLGESPQQEEGRFGKALKFSGENSVSFNGVGHFKRTDPFTISLWLKPTQQQQRAVVLHHSRSWTDAGSRGYELILENGRPSFALVHFWPGNAIRVRMTNSLPLNEWTHLTLTYDGSSHAAGLKIFRNGELASVETIRDNLYKDISYRSEWGDFDVGDVELTLSARFRDSGFKNGLIDELQLFPYALTSIEVKSLHQPVSKPTQNELLIYYLEHVDPTYQAAAATLQKIRNQENDCINDIPEIMVMKEMEPRRPTFVLKRGAYDAPADPVGPGTPETIFPFSKSLPKNRLGLARWLIDPRNPLASRVVVNRIWKMHFGRGLVGTPENFGSQGQLPTHPKLLDWLAKTFVESGWDVKALHRLIVSSATYRQSSSATAQTVALDPENRFLARGPKQRLPAEQIRDAALSVSLLLSPQIGGPSVKPYQPQGLWEQSGLAKSYNQDKGEKLYRRSLYTFWRRTSPPPSMTTFDATSREVCTARRETTTTPLQALVLLNDPQFIEAARMLAERMWQEHHDQPTLCVEETFRTVLGRRPIAAEQTILRQLYDEQLHLFTADPASADKYLRTGEHPRVTQAPSAEIAALAVLANTLMNHDEFVMER